MLEVEVVVALLMVLLDNLAVLAEVVLGDLVVLELQVRLILVEVVADLFLEPQVQMVVLE
jgi:hypothetical protein